MAKTINIWKIDNVETEFDALYKAKEYCKKSHKVDGSKISHFTDGKLINVVTVTIDATKNRISFSRPVKA